MNFAPEQKNQCQVKEINVRLASVSMSGVQTTMLGATHSSMQLRVLIVLVVKDYPMRLKFQVYYAVDGVRLLKTQVEVIQL
ncbi:hypothetical protein HW555_006716 [Spodoptera exigua]|uniref:Uncharacterized protein n=1 Tax=Spodoptera exigua TaxID=7107 RepID=A0A835GHF8_SPOEX|nr:hypothetical protein HW555_006716 [Spodoptera exigua]